MKLTGKNKYYALLGGVVIFYGLFGYFIFGPWSFDIASYKFSGAMSQIESRSRNFTDLNDSYYLMTKKRNLLNELEAEYSSVKDKIPMINDAILDQNKALDFLVMIEGLADKTGASKEISIANVTKDESLKTMVFPLSLKIYGQFPKLANFIKLLQNSPWTIKTGRIEISRIEQIPTTKDVAEKIIQGDVQAIIDIRVLAK